VSATDAARNFADLLDAIEHRGEHFTIVRRGQCHRPPRALVPGTGNPHGSRSQAEEVRTGRPRGRGEDVPKTDARTTTLPSGEPIPVLGLGTWRMAERGRRRQDEVAALRLGIDLGMALVDTAELYGDGAAEELVGEAIEGRREDVFLVSKVHPAHADRRATVRACEASLGRLRTDRLDLYLLHWRGRTPLAETVDAFTRLVDDGKIRYWGVSNFDVSDLEELGDIPAGGAWATDQVVFSLSRRGIEADLLPWCRERGIPVMSYSPVDQGRLLRHPVVRTVAARHDATPAQVALALVLRHDGVNTIPKAGTPEHVRENRAALDLKLTDEDLAELDRAFPPPAERRPLEIL
jgi:diketogulonate reductase-like aldo/keto reductase